MNPVKGLALVGVILNHVVEELGPTAPFTNPSGGWPGLEERLGAFFPPGDHVLARLVVFLGWLGDSCPGVFIVLSGLGLVFAAEQRGERSIGKAAFFRRRLGRVYPAYWLSHLVILAVGCFIAGEAMTAARPSFIPSFLAVRPTDGLFFHINPSWWFVWVIVQLYVIYPFLRERQIRLGNARFLVLMVAATIVSRGAGLLGLRHTDLYVWMTGAFCGTRLAEFALGMVIGSVLSRTDSDRARLESWSRQLRWGGLAYIGGLACSVVWLPLTVVSNLLVSAGLVSLFYVAWRAVRGATPLARLLAWLGGLSYGIYLVHQPLIRWALEFAPEGEPVLAVALVLPACLALGWAVERIAARTMRDTRLLRPRVAGVVETFTLVAAVAAMRVLKGLVQDGQSYRLVAVLLIALAIAMVLQSRRRAVPPTGVLGRSFHAIRLVVILWTVLGVCMFPGRYSTHALGLAVAMVTCVGAARLLMTRFALRSKALIYMAAVVPLALGGVAEWSLERWHPIEANKWGELPALTSHPTRTYSLIPDRSTRLRYNNYDYVLRTNSLGLPGPEIAARAEEPDELRIMIVGDAFTMPEGLPYDGCYAALLQERLETEMPGRSRVINAGVTGYQPWNVLPLLIETLPDVKPDVVVYQFFANRFSGGPYDAQKRRKEIGLEQEYAVRAFNRFHYSQLLAHVRLLRQRVSGGYQARYWKSLLPYLEASGNSFYEPEALDRVRRVLGEIRDACQANDSRLVMIFVPVAASVGPKDYPAFLPEGVDPSRDARFDVDLPLRNCVAMCAQLGVELIDATPSLRRTSERLYFRDSWHWNARGHEVIASSLYDELSSRGYLRPR